MAPRIKSKYTKMWEELYGLQKRLALLETLVIQLQDEVKRVGALFVKLHVHLRSEDEISNESN